MSAITLTDLEPLPELPELDLSKPGLAKLKKSVASLEPVLSEYDLQQSTSSQVQSVALEEHSSLINKENPFELSLRPTTKLLPRPQSMPIPLPSPPAAERIVPMDQPAAQGETTPLADEFSADAKTQIERVQWVDALRGFFLLLFMVDGFGAAGMVKLRADSAWAAVLPYLQNASWVGCNVMDLLQPGFLFLVGMSMALSYRRRTQEGHSGWRLLDHTVLRAGCFIILGLLLGTGVKALGTEWQFTHLLTQIGLGLLPLYVSWRLGLGRQVIVAVMILVGYWAWFAFTPWSQVAVDQAALSTLKEGTPEGLFAHWTRHANAAAMLDRWFLNLPLFARSSAFTQHPEGLTTWNFIPSIVTMLLGLMAGNWQLAAHSDIKKISYLTLAGAVLLVLGWWAGETVCPVIRALWSPSWVLFTGGCLLLLSACFMIIGQLLRLNWLLWPLAVLGINALVAYVLYELAGGWITERVVQHLGTSWIPKNYAPVVHACLPLLVIWLICLWLYRCQARLKI